MKRGTRVSASSSLLSCRSHAHPASPLFSSPCGVTLRLLLLVLVPLCHSFPLASFSFFPSTPSTKEVHKTPIFAAAATSPNFEEHLTPHVPENDEVDNGLIKRTAAQQGTERSAGDTDDEEEAGMPMDQQLTIENAPAEHNYKETSGSVPVASQTPSGGVAGEGNEEAAAHTDQPSGQFTGEERDSETQSGSSVSNAGGDLKEHAEDMQTTPEQERESEHGVAPEEHHPLAGVAHTAAAGEDTRSTAGSTPAAAAAAIETDTDEANKAAAAAEEFATAGDSAAPEETAVSESMPPTAAQTAAAVSEEAPVAGRDAGEHTESQITPTGQTSSNDEESGAHGLLREIAAEDRHAQHTDTSELAAADEGRKSNVATEAEIAEATGNEEDTLRDPYEETILDSGRETDIDRHTGEEETGTAGVHPPSAVGDEGESLQNPAAAAGDGRVASQGPFAEDTAISDAAISDAEDADLAALPGRQAEGSVDEETGNTVTVPPVLATEYSPTREGEGATAADADAAATASVQEEEDAVPFAVAEDVAASRPAGSIATAAEMLEEEDQGKHLGLAEHAKEEAADEEGVGGGDEEEKSRRHAEDLEKLVQWAIEELNKEKRREGSKGDETAAAWIDPRLAGGAARSAESAADDAGPQANMLSPHGDSVLLSTADSSSPFSTRDGDWESHDEETLEDARGEEERKDETENDKEAGGTYYVGGDGNMQIGGILHDTETGDEVPKKEEAQRIDEFEREQLERKPDSAGGEHAEGEHVEEEEEEEQTTVPEELEEQDKPRRSVNLEESREEMPVAAVSDHKEQQQVEVQQVSGQEPVEHISEAAAGEAMHARDHLAWEGQQEGREEAERGSEGAEHQAEVEKKEEAEFDGGRDEEDEDTLTGESVEAPVMDGRTVGREQLLSDSNIEETELQTEKDEEEDLSREQAIMQEALLQEREGRDEEATELGDAPEQQKDEAENEESKKRGEQPFLSDIESRGIQQDATEKENLHAELAQKGISDGGITMHGTMEEVIKELGRETLAAQEPEWEREVTPEKMQEEVEEMETQDDWETAALLDENEEPQQTTGNEDAQSRTGKVQSPEDEEDAEEEKGEGKPTVIEARGEDMDEELLQEANVPSQSRALQELRVLISHLNALARQFEQHQKHLKRKYLGEQLVTVYLDEDSDLHKQEQLMKEVEEHLPALLTKHEELLNWVKEERERILEPDDKRAPFPRGASVDANGAREQLMQHHHLEKLTSAFTDAAMRFGSTVHQINDCCSAFVKDHDRALQVVYEYGRAVELLNMGVRMNQLSKKEIKERVRSCSEAFSVLSRLLATCDKRVASIMGLTGALEAMQGLSLAQLDQAIDEEEHEEAGAAPEDESAAVTNLRDQTAGVATPVGEKTDSSIATRPAQIMAKEAVEQQTRMRLGALQNHRKQVLQAAKQTVRVLQRLSLSVADAARIVVNARAKWMEGLSTQLLKHFDGLVKAGKQLRLHNERRRRMKLLKDPTQRGRGRETHSTWESDDVDEHRTGIRAEELRQPRRRRDHERMGGTVVLPRRGRGKKFSEEDVDDDDDDDLEEVYDVDDDSEDVYDDDDDEDDESEDEDDEDEEELPGSGPYLGIREFLEEAEHRSTASGRNRLQGAFRRKAGQASEQPVGRAQTHLLRDVNLEGWKAIQQMAEGTEIASKVARDTREAIEREIGRDTTTAVLGTLLGIALLLLFAVVIYGYYMVFSYEERINAYKIGKKSGQAVGNA